jgi:hypothetical protein
VVSNYGPIAEHLNAGGLIEIHGPWITGHVFQNEHLDQRVKSIFEACDIQAVWHAFPNFFDYSG